LTERAAGSARRKELNPVLLRIEDGNIPFLCPFKHEGIFIFATGSISAYVYNPDIAVAA
jgi:hypothetical protein